MEIGKQISTGDFLVKGSKKEMRFFKEMFNNTVDKTIEINTKRIIEAVEDWYTIAPRYRTKEKLKEMIKKVGKKRTVKKTKKC